MENGNYSSPTFRSDPTAETPSRTVQDKLSAAIAATVPSAANSETAANVPVQNYAYTGYATTSDPYGYGNTGYAGYYSAYQQPSQQQQSNQTYTQQSNQTYTQQNNQAYTQQNNQAYPHQVGAYQSTGAPQQPISSFQNTVPYAAPTNYNTAYYNPTDYQTSGAYNAAAGSYSNQSQNQNSLWQQGNYATYTNNQYSSYTPEANGSYSTSIPAAAPSQYQQNYSQWANYYSQTEVSCAPGTEKVSSVGTANPVHPAPGGYTSANNQQVAPSTASWRPESSSMDVTPVQPSAAISNVHDGYWKHDTPTFQNQKVGPIQSNMRAPLDSNHTYTGYQEQNNQEYPQVSNVQYPASHQVPYNYYTSLQTASQTVQQVVPQSVQQTVPQTVVPFDPRLNKMQIPINPRIATSLTLGLPKTDKDNSLSSAAGKPLYVSVAPPKMNVEVSSQVDADSILKPGMFPKSLRGYVERALSRCKDDKQMTACQDIMKEVITKATADGTLYTRNWDMEPLFQMPSVNGVENESSQSSTPVSTLTKNRRSPSRRSKSRWEPLSVDKSVEKQSPYTPDVKHGGWLNLSEGDKFSAGKVPKGHLKFTSSDQKATNKGAQRPAKRQCFGDAPSGADNGGASSDSDKEQSLTSYYASAIALADTPEEKKRRESRSKRFEKARGNRSANKYIRPNTVGAGLFTRRANALLLRKDLEDGNSRAVEDIDRDSLTVKGTCQEVEKRYLRLTSAPDPATVRPEEVLAKALLMVQSSQKNYLYKCDQLKSIRQDLTVQRIRNELTVKVYETHARLAIEVGDLSEYNQCQSQLQVLYAEGNKGCDMEFSAYNLLCVILHSNNNRDLLSAMSRLSVDARKDEAVKHALAVRAAVTSGNYVLFFKLYKEAPNLSTCLMDLYVEKIRFAAVKCMSRSYRPTLPVAYISQVLSFGSALPEDEQSDQKSTDGLDECVDWLKAHGACLITDNLGEVLLDSKASASSLFMPEPDDAVAHGDATLAVDDFLTRAPS